ncbi:MAG: hypothetical protein PVF81_02435 [Thioalkalispiraceae bacterium]|jgi:hypothetical protein
MAEIGELKYIPPSLPGRPAKPVSKPGDQKKQSPQQQPRPKQENDDKQDDDDGLPHIDEYA